MNGYRSGPRPSRKQIYFLMEGMRTIIYYVESLLEHKVVEAADSLLNSSRINFDITEVYRKTQYVGKR